MSLRRNRTYIGFTATLAGLTFITSQAITRGFEPPQPNPVNGQLMVEEGALTRSEWRWLKKKHLIIAVLSWGFATSGTTVNLSSLTNWNPANNTIYLIGAAGSATAGTPGIGGCCGSNGVTGNGGGGGACVIGNNYSLITSGTVNVVVGAGATKWDTTNNWAVAAAGSSTTGGTVASCTVPSGGTAYRGGNAATQGAGAGAAGPHGQGGDASGGTPGTGDAGNTAAGANGAQFATTPATGSGGGGSPGSLVPASPGSPGSAGGLYGAGGGGGGPGSQIGGSNGGAAGASRQGLIAYSWTPATTSTVHLLMLMGVGT
jgi:hypothetical protein